MKKQYISKHTAWIFTCCVLSLLCFNLVSAQSPSDDFITITPENVDQLELGYVLPGFCGIDEPNQDLVALWKVGVYDLLTGQRRFEIAGDYGAFSPLGNYFEGADDGVISTQTGLKLLTGNGFFSADEKYFAAREDGVYDLATLKRLFPINSTAWFSPNNRLVAVWNDAIYEVKTGQRLFALPDGIVAFSPNSKYFAVWDHGIYDTATGKQLIPSSGAIPEFSADSRYVLMYDDGAYNIETRQKLFNFPPRTSSAFSNDSKSIAIIGDGLYDLSTGERQFRIGGNSHAAPIYFGDTRWMSIADDGVYDLVANEKSFDVSGFVFSATQDGSLIAIRQKGIYETATAHLKFRIDDARFAAHDKLVISLIWTLDAPDSTFCAVYGIKGDKWPYRSGLVDTSHTQLYDAPNGEERLDAQGRPLTTNKQQAVFAQTPDKEWLRVADSTWVKAADVKPISLPDGIPTENP